MSSSTCAVLCTKEHMFVQMRLFTTPFFCLTFTFSMLCSVSFTVDPCSFLLESSKQRCKTNFCLRLSSFVGCFLTFFPLTDHFSDSPNFFLSLYFLILFTSPLFNNCQHGIPLLLEWMATHSHRETYKVQCSPLFTLTRRFKVYLC